MTLAPNASVLEIAWTVMALPGFGLSLYNTAGAYGDLCIHWQDGLRSIGWVGLVKVTIVLVMCLLVVLTGVVAMGAPEPIRPELAEASDFVAGCLILMDAMTLGLAIAFFLERRYIVPHIHVLRKDV